MDTKTLMGQISENFICVYRLTIAALLRYTHKPDQWKQIRMYVQATAKNGLLKQW